MPIDPILILEPFSFVIFHRRERRKRISLHGILPILTNNIFCSYASLTFLNLSSSSATSLAIFVLSVTSANFRQVSFAFVRA